MPEPTHYLLSDEVRHGRLTAICGALVRPDAYVPGTPHCTACERALVQVGRATAYGVERGITTEQAARALNLSAFVIAECGQRVPA